MAPMGIVESPKERACDSCGEMYPPYRPWQRFCSKKCRWKAWAELYPREFVYKNKRPKKLKTKEVK